MAEPTIDQKLAISDEAKRLLGDSVFNGVLSVLVKEYMETLMKKRPGSDEGLVAHASLIALDDIKNQLRALENNGAMIRDKLKRESQGR